MDEIELFRNGLREDPRGAFRAFVRSRTEGEDILRTRALADELFAFLSSDASNPKLLHEAAVIFGTVGPAADLSRALSLFGAAERLDPGVEPLPLARLLHNRGNARQALGGSVAELREAIADFDRALALRRGAGAEIAASATLDARGAAHAKLAAILPSDRTLRLALAAADLAEALTVRTAAEQPIGFATTSLRLARVLRTLGRNDEAAEAFTAAASALRDAGKPGEARLAEEEASAALG